MDETEFASDDQDEAEGHILSEELIEEFLDYCEDAFRPTASLSFNTRITHLIREDRKVVLDEFIKYLTQKINPEDDIIL